MRILGMLLALVGIFMGVLGLGGSSVLCFVSLVPLILGGLLFASANRADKEAEDERRHREIVEAMKTGKQQ